MPNQQQHSMSRPDRTRLRVVGRQANGLPRTYRLQHASKSAAYRRLAVAILGLDVATLAAELRSSRAAQPAPRAA
jgi:hypothetical protein